MPLPAFVVDALVAHRTQYPAGPAGEVFTNSAGGPLRRSMFRTRVWRPALVRSGLLGKVVCVGPDKWTATWPDRNGVTWTKAFTTERDAIRHIVLYAAGGLRFHDIRHSYATWLVSDGLPVNDVQRVMGHEKALPTLDRYTHSSAGWINRVRDTFADFRLTQDRAPDNDE